MSLYSDTLTIASRLRTDATIKALVKGNIFPVVATRGANGSHPIIVYRNAGRVSPESKDGGFIRAFEVRVASTSYETTLKTADAVAACLSENEDPYCELSGYDELFELEEETYVFTLVFSIN